MHCLHEYLEIWDCLRMFSHYFFYCEVYEQFLLCVLDSDDIPYVTVVFVEVFVREEF